MNKFITFSLLYVSIFTTEIISSFFILFFDSSNYQGNFDGVVLWNFWRILFYGLPFLVLYFLFYNYFRKIKAYRPLLFSLFNLTAYVLLSYLSEVIIGKNVPLPPRDLMFWVTCIAIFISPLLVRQIPYHKRLMEKLLQG